jgi:hypothetical protein
MGSCQPARFVAGRQSQQLAHQGCVEFQNGGQVSPPQARQLFWLFRDGLEQILNTLW